MFFTQIYKPGQGKWARGITGAGFGVLVFFGLLWLLGELEGTMGPRSQVTTLTPSGPVAGQEFTVTVTYTDLKDGAQQQFKATASYTAGEAEKLEDVAAGLNRAMAPSNSPVWKLIRPSFREGTSVVRLSADRTGLPFEVEAKATGSAVLSSERSAEARSGDATVVKGIVIVIVIAVFGLLGWWLLNKPNIVEFMIATESEMRKVNWPTRKDIVGSTWVVIVGTFLITFVLFVVDLGFTWFFTLIKILDVGL